MHEKQYLPHKKQKNRFQMLSEGGFRALLGMRNQQKPNSHFFKYLTLKINQLHWFVC